MGATACQVSRHNRDQQLSEFPPRLIRRIEKPGHSRTYRNGERRGIGNAGVDCNVDPYTDRSCGCFCPAGLCAEGHHIWDDFTDPKSGWPNSLEFGNYYIGYHEPNDYHVEVHVPNDRAVVAVPKRTLGDFTMETEVQADPNDTAKAGNFRYGLVFRRSGNQYYAFVVSLPRAKTWHVLKSSRAVWSSSRRAAATQSRA